VSEPWRVRRIRRIAEAVLEAVRSILKTLEATSLAPVEQPRCIVCASLQAQAVEGIVRCSGCLFFDQAARILCAWSFSMNSGTSGGRISDSNPNVASFSISSSWLLSFSCCPLVPELRLLGEVILDSPIQRE